MKVLITGITGFVGSNLSTYLEGRGVEVSGLGRSTNSSNYTYEDLSALSGFQTWVHTAGKAHDVSGKSHLEDYLAINYELTKRVFKAFLEDEVSNCFIYLSSVKAAVSSVEGELTEDVSEEIKDAYGISKRKSEEFLLEQAGKTTKTVIILRPCMIHGPGNKGNLNLLFNLVNKGIPYPLGSFENSRSFLSIENLSFVIYKQIQDTPKLNSGIYNISDDNVLSTKEIIQLMAEVREIKAKVWNIPKGIVHRMASVGDVLRLPLNNHRLKKLTEDFRVSNQKLKSSLNIQEMPISAIEGMRKTLKSFSNG